MLLLLEVVVEIVFVEGPDCCCDKDVEEEICEDEWIIRGGT